jgi:hypothetical protein
METTMEGSKQIVEQYTNEEKNFNDTVQTIIETQIISQQAKYKNYKAVVEPNLSKRMELRKNRDRMRANNNSITEASICSDLPKTEADSRLSQYATLQ